MAKSRQHKGRPRHEEKREFDEEVIQLDRVTRVVKGGRRMRFRATVVIGNRRGKVGIGIGKSNEVASAVKKAVSQAKKGLVTIPIYNDTIPHRIQTKYKASKVLLLPAGPGTGIIAGGAARKVIELSGIKNILSKTLGSSNRVNNTKATFMALTSLRKREIKGKADKETPSAEAEKAKAEATPPSATQENPSTHS